MGPGFQLWDEAKAISVVESSEELARLAEQDLEGAQISCAGRAG
jgi:hypothetical protein